MPGGEEVKSLKAKEQNCQLGCGEDFRVPEAYAAKNERRRFLSGFSNRNGDGRGQENERNANKPRHCLPSVAP